MSTLSSPIEIEEEIYFTTPIAAESFTTSLTSAWLKKPVPFFSVNVSVLTRKK